jgi:dTDP-4-amino-4,6-dideoxygalactose transaminase
LEKNEKYMQIPFSPPDITEKEIDAVVHTLKSSWITTGSSTKLFEKKIAEFCGTPKAVCLNSATAGLELALRILGIGAGDEVITSAYTYSASAAVIHHTGAKIVLVDTAPESYLPDGEALSRAVTSKTKAIIPVDIGGRLCDYDSIYKIIEAKKHLFKPNGELQERLSRVAVIADAAHSFGAKRDNLYSGTFADFTVFSFHAVKNLTTAEGGAVTWRKGLFEDDGAAYAQFILLALHGQSKDALAKMSVGAWEYDIKLLGYKCNMTDIAAALGLAQLERYPALLQRRRELVERYERGLDKSRIEIMPHADSSRHLLLTRVKGASEERRNAIILKMAERGIATNVHYKPLPTFTAYKALGFSIESYPNSYNQYKNEITLPLYTLLTDGEADYVIENFNSIVGEGL